MDIPLISLAFIGGVFAFFSPCSFPLLPSYISYTLSKEGGHSPLYRGFRFGFLASLGLTTVYLAIILIQVLVFEAISAFFLQLTTFLAVLLIIVGVFLIVRKKIVFLSRLTSPLLTYLDTVLSRGRSYYVYGLVYGISSLTCSAPIALMIASISLSYGLTSFITVVSVYLIGLNSLMITVTVLTILFKDFVQNRLTKIVPYLDNATAILLILAGIYILLFEYGFLY